MNKEMYEAKQRYAENKMYKNSLNENLTQEQHDALSWLCSVRHEMHTNQDAFWNTEHSNYSTFNDYIDYGINNRLTSAGLSSIDFDVAVEDLPDETDYYELNLYDSLDEMIEESYECSEKINNAIESYLLSIDEQNGTEYCPTGFARLY